MLLAILAHTPAAEGAGILGRRVGITGHRYDGTVPDSTKLYIRQGYYAGTGAHEHCAFCMRNSHHAIRRASLIHA